MVKISNNKVSLVNNSKNNITRRQDAPKIYDMTTVAYVANPNYILKNRSIFEGKVEALSLPKERAIDIDDELNLFIAKKLFRR